jgi:S-adenosylmethionine decarboxylase
MKKTETCNFGVHLMVDGYEGDPVKLSSRESVIKFLNELPDKLGMHKITKPVAKEFDGNDIKDPGGYSGFVMIAESHISIHTFPARKFVSIDVYTCKNEMDKDFVLSHLKETFGLGDMEINYVNRGTKYPLKNLI